MVTETSRIGRQLQLDSRVTLLDALREYLDLVSTKKGCDQGCSRVEILSKEVSGSHALQGFR
jgi:aerobic-type carbon monoxide dehydrogenase small subunit (CoxS/CutS family)